MKEKLLKVLHFLKLDVLLLWVLERLSRSLTKKHLALKNAVESLFACACFEEDSPTNEGA